MPTDEELIRDTRPYGERPGEPFGAATHRLKDRHRARLLAEGVPNDYRLLFAVERAYEEEMRHQLTYQQRQDLARWLGLKWVARRTTETTELTDEELAYLIERLAGVNDPVGQSTLAKVTRKLKSREKTAAAIHV